ncbi:MAG: CDF family Co(II)/Ni(II) efflux transporter DmeF [Planctomycetes bacterium]|nr:CDF family Co(II)/Ni(II) efflux transporter DmeF [Planctomycetota bacterium]
MHAESIPPWEHDHVFGQDVVRPAERRTKLVIAVTLLMMAAEIAAGLAYGSMALLADGLHMGSHAVALGLSAAAYVYARRFAGSPRFSFGTGKVNALAGFTGAVLLAVFALLMGGESVARLLHPVAIAFDQALVVAVLGLVVNAVCMLVLGGAHEHGHGHAHQHEHEHEDHNLRSAYLHVAADALTSVLAIGALLAGRTLGESWLDPAMGVVGALLVARWSLQLVRQTSRVLLDHQAPEPLRGSIVAALEADGDTQVTDLHVWSVGPGLHAVEVALVASTPRPPDDYKRLLPADACPAHVTVEVHRRPDAAGS